MATTFNHVAPNLWTALYPLSALGVHIGRSVTIIRLESGNIIIHSSAPFDPRDRETIEAFGKPAWLVDALLRHDTFAKDAHAVFPDLPYFAPPGFDQATGLATRSLAAPPEEWSGEVDVVPVDGAPEMSEYVFLHRPSRTLIVTDLLMHFVEGENFFTELMLRIAIAGGSPEAGISRLYKHAVKDEPAFLASLRTIMNLEFDRIIVGHGQPVSSNGKAILHSAFEAAGFPV